MSTHLKGILKKLNLNKENGLYDKNDELPDYPSRIKIPLESIDYDAIFDLENKPMIIFKEFDSTYDVNVKNRINNFHKSVWNLNETPVLFIVLKDEIQIYNGFIFNKEGNNPLDRLTQNDVIKDFSYEELVSGRYWNNNEDIFSGDTRVQDYLIKNLRCVRDILNDDGLEFNIINNLLGRLIFSRYLIDRNYLKKDFFIEEYGLDFIDLISNKDKLYEYFEYLRETFNGDMFPLSVDERSLVKNSHLKKLSSLFNGDDICIRQTVLFDVYDFSIIPIELISNIYEVFLNEKDKKDQKAYYTPPFLVDHILNQTLSEKIKSLNTSQIKILDPACGSGIFLVESLRRLIKKEMNDKERELSKIELKNIIQNNLFGIDIDENAINISIFSIYLTLLDYYDNVTVEKFRFPELRDINIFKADFFDRDDNFNKLFKRFGGFDIILGNPPWSKNGGPYENYCDEFKIPLAEKQITQAFLVRCKDFAKNGTKLALIVNSKILYNSKGKYKEFREYFLNHFIINTIFELAPLRKRLFKEASGPGVIIFYKVNKDDNIKNDVEYISLKPNKLYKLFRFLTIEKNDRKIIPQKCFLEYDWLWKVVLYGNINDFFLVKKLKNNSNTIEKVINSNNDLESGVGVFVGDNGKYDSSDFKDTFFLDIKNYKKIIQRYFIDSSIDSRWNFDYVKRIDKSLYTPPYVIIKQSPESRHYCAIAAFSDEKMIFKKGIMAIRGTANCKKQLMNFLALINSKLFTYYIFLTSPLLGIERDVMAKKEILSFPFIADDKISQKACYLHNLYENLYSSCSDLELKNEIEYVENSLNEDIFDLYGLNSSERDLVNYVNISIDLYHWRDSPFRKPNKQELEEYAEIFLSFFKYRLKNQEKYFSVDIYQTKYFIAMNFMISKHNSKSIKFSKNKNIHNVLNNLGNLSFEEINKNLYNLKDIKGFEKSSFYIIKPNEFKNWHKSIARVDLNEFINAIIRKDTI